MFFWLTADSCILFPAAPAAVRAIVSYVFLCLGASECGRDSRLRRELSNNGRAQLRDRHLPHEHAGALWRGFDVVPRARCGGGQLPD